MSEPKRAADLLVEILETYGIKYVFGNPGTTELPFMQALVDSDLEYVLGLHEDIAVGMASGYARAKWLTRHEDSDTLPVGFANLHIAPGLAHGLGNLYGAQMARSPLILTAGNHSTDFRHEEPILSGDLVSMAEPFTKWSAEILHPDTLPTMLRRAVRTALSPPPGPVFLSLPLDIMMAEVDGEPERLGAIPTPGRGNPAHIETAAERIAAANRPVIVVGDQVGQSGPEAVAGMVAAAEAAGAAVYGEILSSDANFPTEHEQWKGFIPPDEDVAREIQAVDTLVFVGISTHTTLMRHRQPLVDHATTFVHIGDDAWELGKNQPADVAVLGDPGSVLPALAAEIRARVSNDERARRLDAMVDPPWNRGSGRTTEARRPADRPDVSTLARILSESIEEAFVVDEGVTAKYPFVKHWGMDYGEYISNKGGGLGYGLPAAVGAAIAEADRPDPRTVLGFIGDGSYLYYPHTLYTAARYNVDLTVVIPDNRSYKILKQNTAKLFQEDVSELSFVGMDFDPAVDIVRNVSSHGGAGEYVDRVGDLEEAVERAVESSGPYVLDVLVED